MTDEAFCTQYVHEEKGMRSLYIGLLPVVLAGCVVAGRVGSSHGAPADAGDKMTEGDAAEPGELDSGSNPTDGGPIIDDTRDAGSHGDDCIPSPMRDPVEVHDTPTGETHYFKAERGGAPRYGNAVALSPSHEFLAVAATADQSGGTGVGADPTPAHVLHSGAVYVYRNYAGYWVQDAYIKASNTDALDEFGTSLAFSEDGSVLAVAAPYEDSLSPLNGDPTDNSGSNVGAVYVYRHDNSSGWRFEAYIKAPNVGSGDLFGLGLAVSGSGTVLAVGAIGEDSGERGLSGSGADESASMAGAVYIYRYDRGEWRFTDYIKATNAAAGDGFGASVALSWDGRRLAVGAPGEDSSATGVGGDSSSDAADQSGAAYIYRFTCREWALESYIKATNTRGRMGSEMEGEQFGTAVALSEDGDVLVVGAPYERGDGTGVDPVSTNLNTNHAGAAYVYRRADLSWSEWSYLKGAHVAAGEFGRSLALGASGTSIVVGAPWDNNGVAVHFERTSHGGWEVDDYLYAPNEEDLHTTGFGYSVAVAHDAEVIAVGNPLEGGSGVGIDWGDPSDFYSDPNMGAVYTFQ